MPVLFHLPGGLPVYTSSIIIGLGATLGMAVIAWRTPAEFRAQYLDAGLWTMLGGLIGGRMVFVLTNWPYFKHDFAEIPLFNQGGFSWAGALLGSLVAFALTSRFDKLSFGSLALALLPLLGTLSVSAWLACWIDGRAYGQPTDAWWGLPAVDEWGQVANRVPIQMLGAISSACLIGILILGIARRVRPVATAFIGIFSLSAIMLLLSFFRADPVQHWQGLRYDTWASLIILVISILALLVISVNRIRSQPPDQTPGG